MKTINSLHAIRAAALLAALLVASNGFATEPTYRNRDNKSANDAGEGLYSNPYQMPTRAEILEQLQRIRAFMESASPTQVIDRETKQPITDPRSAPVATATIKSGSELFNPLSYEMGVVHAGMLRAAKVTGDTNFAAFTRWHTQFIHDWLPYCVAVEAQILVKNNFFREVTAPYGPWPGTDGKIKAAGNIFDNTAGTIAPGTDIIFTPPYGYALDPGANIPNIITNWAGAGKIGF